MGRTGARVLYSSFSRDQEREADTQGLEWAIAAGYNPLGAVRLHMALAAPSAASLLPIQGFSLERYATYVNELAAAPENQHAKVYAKYKLTEASAGKLTEAWVKRMQEDSALARQWRRVRRPFRRRTGLH